MKISDNFKTHTIYVFIACTVILFFTSCKDNSSGPDDLFGSIGSFSAETSGDLSLSFSGVALFATQVIDGPTGNIFVLSMSTISSSPNYVAGVTILNSGRLASGTYTIDEEGTESSGYFTIIPSEDEVITYRVTGGELNISSSSTESVQGNLTLFAILPENGNSVTVTATFNASCQQSGFTTCD
jgi:hypothetical protein